ncbi:MAG: hypothetical protein K2N78_12830, partial [Oscillospiraceae bacterium]|nr:hypothetical protein [Oscillospiraceae bacterium]
MSGDVQMELWLHEYKMAALSSVLEEQGSTVEKRMQEALLDLYAELVPQEVQQEIRTRIDAEYAAEKAAREAARKYTVFRVRENEQDECFRLEKSVDIVDASQYVRRYLRREPGMKTDSFAEAFPKREPITAEVFDQMAVLHMEKPDKVTGLFDLDFNNLLFSAVHATDGWKTYEMGNISVATYYAFCKNGLSKEQRQASLLGVLKGNDIPSAGHLSAKEISFADEICEIDGKLNFYLENVFDVDKVFGTRTAKRGGQLNIYASCNMPDGQVCDALELTLIHADGHEESLSYPLNTVEKAVLLRKMDAYCQEQTGLSLTEY